MSSTSKQKKVVKGLRIDPEILARLDEACEASGMKTEEALRLAATALVEFHATYGMLPRDIVIYQRPIGGAYDLRGLAERVLAVAEKQAAYPAEMPVKSAAAAPHKEERPQSA